MIKAVELRVGNLIMYNPPEGTLHGPFVITEINDRWVGYKNGGGLMSSFVDIPRLPLEWCDPIILTEEWVNKFGLANGKEIFRGLTIYQNMIRDGSGRYNGYCFSTTRADVEYRFVMGFSVTTVHRLQNMYYLFTGLELVLTK